MEHCEWYSKIKLYKLWKKWYFGHFHTDADINEVAACIYERIVKIEE